MVSKTSGREMSFVSKIDAPRKLLCVLFCFSLSLFVCVCFCMFVVPVQKKYSYHQSGPEAFAAYNRILLSDQTFCAFSASHTNDIPWDVQTRPAKHFEHITERITFEVKNSLWDGRCSLQSRPRVLSWLNPCLIYAFMFSFPHPPCHKDNIDQTRLKHDEIPPCFLRNIICLRGLTRH